MSKVVLNLAELDVNVESRLTFLPNPNLYNGICLGYITRCELVTTENEKLDKDGNPSTYDYKGCTTTSLLLEFKQINPDPKDTSARFLVHKETPVVGTKKNGEEMSDSDFIGLVTTQFNRLQSIVNALDNGGCGTSTKIKELTVSLEDAPEVRASKFKKMYQHFFAQITGAPAKNAPADFKPRFENVPVWIKVISEYKTAKRYVLPNFVGSGIIEVARKGIPTILSISPSESIVLGVKANDVPAANTAANLSKAPDATSVNSMVDDILNGLSK